MTQSTATVATHCFGVVVVIKKNEATKQELIDYIRQFPDDYTRLRNRIKTIQEEFGLQLYIPPAKPKSTGGGLGGDLGGWLGCGLDDQAAGHELLLAVLVGDVAA